MSSYDSDSSMAALDQYVAPGLRLWMLIALVSGVLLIMIVIVCCFMRIRIPRTKRQIELVAAKRKLRKQSKKRSKNEENNSENDKAQTIVMNSLSKTSRSTTKDTALLVSGGNRHSNNNGSHTDSHKTKEIQHTVV
uniref:Transmembrane inner ear n=1 Tax=Parastrongyloides trichosuri TaxID=131310 RepID=A0A0N4ZUK0_PARTI